MSDRALDQLLDPFTLCLDAESAQRIAEFRIVPSVEQRVHFLAERANEGVLTEEERSDYEALIMPLISSESLSKKPVVRLTSTFLGDPARS